MRLRTIVLLPVFMTILISQAMAVDPPWIMLERGKDAFERRDLTTALDTLLDAVEEGPEYPEAEYWLGRVYEAQGQLVLAEEQYRRALDISIYLRVPQDALTYSYRLAGLLMDQGASRALEAEAILSGIAESEGAFTPESIALDHSLMRVLTDYGIDELLYLYRNELQQSLEARRALGEAAWKDGRYRSSLLHSSRVVLSLLSTAAGARMQTYPYWRFDIDTVADAAQPDRDVRYPGASDGVVYLIEGIISSDPDLLLWLDESGLWSQLYLLGSSLFAEGFEESAVSVWSVLTIPDTTGGIPGPRVEAGRWGRLAVRQLDEPFISAGFLSP